jgi:hypothetical protein
MELASTSQNSSRASFERNEAQGGMTFLYGDRRDVFQGRLPQSNKASF